MVYQRAWWSGRPSPKAIVVFIAIALAQIPASALAERRADGDAAGEGGHASAGGAAALPVVTVTASKRDQSLATLNSSAVVVERPALDAAQVNNTMDLRRVLPGVQMANGGSALFPMISVRGVSSAQDFYNPALTVYVDGVPQLPTFTMQTLLNVDRVELLKGPQGTLYGKSAEGGVLDIVTLAPDNQLRIHADAGMSSRLGNVERLEVAGPIVEDLLYGSVSLAHVDAPGDLTNPVTGVNHEGGSRSYAGTARLRLAPSGAPWEINLTASRDCMMATQDIYVPFDNIGNHTAGIAANLPAQYAEPYLNRCGSNYALSGRYDFGQWRLTAMSAWQTSHFSRDFSSGTSFLQQPENWRQNVQELRLATHAPGRRWDAVFGLYRQDVDQSRSSLYSMTMPSFATMMTALSGNESSSLSAYGDATWHVTHAFDLSAGLRVSHDQAWTDFDGSSMLPSGGYAGFAGANARNGNRVLGKVSAGYQIDRAWRAYANVSQGYKPGGFNLAPTSIADAGGFGAERAVSYELGTRYDGNALRGSLALYRVDIRNVQLYAGAPGYMTLNNVGDSRSIGAEFGLEWGLARGWTVGLDAFVNHATFRHYTDAVGCPTCAGNNVPFAPRYGVTLNLAGTMPTQAGKLRPSVAVRWLGAQYFDKENLLRQGGYALVDASIGWQPRRDVELTLYAHNLTNRDYRVYGFNGPGGKMAELGLGRTVGFTVAFDY
ncbi:TonB-dependent receptor [Burkholderia plantarii]|uniref:TonB-dependent receptor n=1 Tax=Burkholderia plantarii TaxID=41899 RepID=UPI0018DD321A|nr:TonB-dependent receptor [Burkholderia plantarii]MBI0329429.1 TonB-dependent receptor [Burkholderia plantarii]